MEYVVGIVLALTLAGGATAIGFDRSRTFYPVILIMIASYYCLFAAMSGSETALWQDTFIAALFAGLAIAGFRSSLWLIVAALGAHSAMDVIHHNIVTNAGVPLWWPGFCSIVDVTAATYLAICIRRRGEPEMLAESRKSDLPQADCMATSSL